MAQNTLDGFPKPRECPELPGLILTRTENEWIDVFLAGFHLQIGVNEIRRNRVSLKLIAPSCVKIVRREVLVNGKRSPRPAA